jgi:hypothetical protein
MDVADTKAEPNPEPRLAQRKNRHALPYASSITETEHQELLEKLALLPENIDAETSQLTTLSYQVDHTIREACLADPKQWREELGTLVFTSSNKLKVYLGRPDTPLSIDEAQTRIHQLGMNTVLTARIVLGLWNTRKSNRLLQTENGSVVMRLEEVFEWRGLKKRSRKVVGSDKRYDDGYRLTDKSEVLKDLDLLASCCVKGQITCTSEGKRVQETINSSYLYYGILIREAYRPEGTTVGVFVRPGDWLHPYETYSNYFVATTDRRILQFNPHDQQHELKLILFLTERWRQHKHKPDEPIIMAHLLALSMIHVDKGNLTNRFAPRIQEALDTLQKRGTIGQQQCITPVDTSQPRWGNTWLASQWIITPLKDKAIGSVNNRTHQIRTSSTPNGIRPIETIHAGYRFRARDEARWSIFFETLDVEYRYELEGYDFDGIRYLPDFWLREQNCWIEIKGPEPSEDELQKARLLSLYTEKPVYIFFGDIWLVSQQKYGGAYRCSGTQWEREYYWYECHTCKMVEPASSRENGSFPCQCSITLTNRSTYNNASNRLLAAYRAARQARFEHRE